jgi:hypothetical protein
MATIEITIKGAPGDQLDKLRELGETLINGVRGSSKKAAAQSLKKVLHCSRGEGVIERLDNFQTRVCFRFNETRL